MLCGRSRSVSQVVALKSDLAQTPGSGLLGVIRKMLFLIMVFVAGQGDSISTISKKSVFLMTSGLTYYSHIFHGVVEESALRLKEQCRARFPFSFSTFLCFFLSLSPL